MKWRLFQTKNVDSFLVGDFFAQVSVTLGQGVFKDSDPRVLITLKNKILEWIFEEYYWQQMEKSAVKTLNHKKFYFLEEAKRNIEKSNATLSLISRVKLNLAHKLDAFVADAKNIVGIFLGLFESVLPGLIRKELPKKLSEIEASKIISVITQPEDFTFKGHFELELLQCAKQIKQKWSKISDLKKLLGQNNEIQKSIKILFLKYFYLPVDMSGEPWSEAYFLGRIYQITSRNSEKQIKAKILKLQNSLLDVKKKKTALLEKFGNSKKLIFLSKIAGEMALLRDWRKSLVSLIVLNILGIVKFLPPNLINNSSVL